MVWSSAQPHSVDDMVHHAFGDDRIHLVAVWARDTLGLTDEQYHSKVQTVKDLRKPWEALYAPIVHSALTTLLLDDSTLKAALQPWNHLCIPDYTRELRNRDLAELNRAAEGATGPAEAQMDPTLLAVVGVLHTLRIQTNVAGWVRAGGLWGPRGEAKNSGEGGEGAGNEHAGGKLLWFEVPETLRYWVGEGRRALEELGIAVEHGLTR
ncbi:hypothetical protein K488DRAFT_44651 [Vararia minispora EC-137]|uniref:Uncharacterized protein n=1 Tax=Vararia minispora EC-137 TaxID=1314806 RepID=A0ACB8QTY0_9AGAM|nr:hypothetical protein K488DRAFT_44651 [Vararia minispora EC-137]